jgi:phosphate transport system permease protein
LKKEKILFRIIKDRIFKFFIFFISFLSVLPLLFIILYLFKNGISVINWDFLLNLPKPVGEIGGGISNAIIGSIILIIISSILSIPLGVSSGIFLSEYKDSKLSYWVRLCVEILQGIPSIVIGIIAYLWVVITTGTFSAFSGGVALGIMMIPIIVRATEETLNLIPHSLKETSLALGVPYYKTILKVILPAGTSGILTGILLSLARIAGETAPLLFTSFGNPFMSFNIFKPINSLPLLIFNYATSPYQEWLSLAWGASFILIMLVLMLNIIAKIIARKWKVQF